MKKATTTTTTSSFLVIGALLSMLVGTGLCLSGKFIYISDIHFDPLMDSVAYNQTTYCRDPALNLGVPEEVQQHYRRLAGYRSTDTSVSISAPLSAGGLYGRYGCDSPYDLMDAAYANAAEVVPNPDFILYGGDVAAHDMNASMVQLSWDVMYSVIVKYFGTGVPVYITIGNNDLDTHYHANCDAEDLSTLSSKLSNWRWLDPDQQGTFAHMGTYSQTVPDTNLRVISINTNSVARRPVYIDPQDPNDCGQLVWLEKELAKAGSAGENVILLGHIPAGTDSFNGNPLWNETYLAEFQRVVERYAKEFPDMLVYTTFGHVHKTEFRLMGNASDPYNGIGIIGAVSPVYSNNPMYRVMTYSTEAPHTISDFEDHFMDLRASVREGKPLWYKDYEFSKAYEIEGGFSTKAVATLIENAKRSSIKLSELMVRSTSHFNSEEKSIVCIMTTNNKSEYDACVASWLN